MTQATPWPVDRIAQAITDPSSVVGRCFGPSWGAGQVGYMAEQETFARWATRAVIAVIDEFDRDLQRKVNRAVQIETEMAAKWFPVNSDRVQVPPRIYEDIARRWPDGTEPLTPPKPLAEEFPAELGDRPPARADYCRDVDGDRWDNLDGSMLRHELSLMAYDVAKVKRDWGPVRWFDADDNEITSAGAR